MIWGLRVSVLLSDPCQWRVEGLVSGGLGPRATVCSLTPVLSLGVGVYFLTLVDGTKNLQGSQELGCILILPSTTEMGWNMEEEKAP